jgi:dihydroorotase-like cyclic amidohydrolase
MAVGKGASARRRADHQRQGQGAHPGLYDLHTHWTPGGEPASIPQIATAYVKAGVTTVDDFNEQPEAFAPCAPGWQSWPRRM